MSLGVSAGYRYINLSPNLPNEDTQGDTFTLTPDVQAQYKFNQRFNADLISSYSFGQQSSFNRLRFGVYLGRDWRVSLETIQLNGRSYGSQNLGIFASSNLSNGLSLEINGGVSDNNNGNNSPYIGIGFSKFF